MIAMQYSFTLPADYDMSIIKQRIVNNGAKLDGFTGLIFKTYLYALKDDPKYPSNENLYAPLYLWRDAESMTRFLSSPGFAALTDTFGWPQIQSWLVYKVPETERVKSCDLVRRIVTPIAPYSNLAERLNADSAGDLLAWNCAIWQQLRVDFLQNSAVEDTNSAEAQYYRIGYIAS